MVGLSMSKWILITGALFAGTAVLIGAFGAHSLKNILEPKAMGWIQTGVSYQTSHALAILVCGLLPPSKLLSRCALLFIFGIVLFSGSLYVMAITGMTKLGMVTPIGGTMFIAAWTLFCWSVSTMETK